MYSKLKLPTDSGFGIWFDKKEKSEYYVTKLYLYRVKKVKYIYNKYKTIKVANAKSKTNITHEDIDYFNPYTERYGRFLINFINANFSTSNKAFETFFVFYGLELLKEFTNNIPNKKFYNDGVEFLNEFEKIFCECKEDLINLQKVILDCVDYTYNLKDNNENNEYYPIERFASFILREDLYKYSINTNIFFNNLIGYKTELSRLVNNKPSEIRKKMKNNEITLKTSNIFYSHNLSNIVFYSLYELATNQRIIIKNCQNCGKYFIPTTKQTEIYCDITYYENERSCRDTGAGETYKKNINEVMGYIIYRRTYQKRLMQIKRHPDPSGENVSKFHNWRQKAQSKIRAFKKGNLTEDELTSWMINNQDL